MSKIQAHVYVSGLVQGVFFRANAVRKARSLGVTGWVRNLLDGRVELLIEGEQESVDQMVEWCRAGPPAARIQGVEVNIEHYQGEFDGFAVRH